MDSFDTESPGAAALEAALARHGEELAAVIDHADHAKSLIETIVLVLASAEEDDLDRVTESLTSVIESGDALSTDDTAALAALIGDNADDLASALETLVRLERNGTLDALATLAETAAELELDEAAVEGGNRVLHALSAAEQTSQPVGLFGIVRATRTPDVRAGLGYLLAVVRGLAPS